MIRTWKVGEHTASNPEDAQLIPCMWCKRKAPLKVWRVRTTLRRFRRGAKLGERLDPPELWADAWIHCADEEDCRRYRHEKEKKAQARRKLRAPAPPNAGALGCPWCGEPVLLDQTKEGWKRRQARSIHRDDGWEINAPDHGGPSCLQLLNWWRSPRTALPYLLEQQDDQCASCGASPDDVCMEVDHRKPIWDGGMNALENLQVLCVDCHKEKTRQEAKERRRRRREAAACPT